MKPTNEKLAADILSAGKKEFLEKGFQKASMRSIASSLAVTTGAIYRYYTDKEAIFEALVEEPAKELADRYRASQQKFAEMSLKSKALREKLKEQVITVLAEEEGCIERILAQDIGIACMTLGGGRENKESTIDHGVGIVLTKKISNMVKKGETLALIHANSKEKAVLASNLVKNAYQIAKEPAKKAPMVKCIIRE